MSSPLPDSQGPLQRTHLHSAFLAPLNRAGVTLDLSLDELDRAVSGHTAASAAQAAERIVAFASRLSAEGVKVRLSVYGFRGVPLTRQCIIEADLAHNREFWVGLSHDIGDWIQDKDEYCEGHAAYWRNHMDTMGRVSIAADAFFDEGRAGDLDDLAKIVNAHQENAALYDTSRIAQALSQCFNDNVAYRYRHAMDPACAGRDEFYIDAQGMSERHATRAAREINKQCRDAGLEGVQAGRTLVSWPDYQVHLRLDKHDLSTMFDNLARHRIDVSGIVDTAIAKTEADKAAETERKRLQAIEDAQSPLWKGMKSLARRLGLG